MNRSQSRLNGLAANMLRQTYFRNWVVTVEGRNHLPEGGSIIAPIHTRIEDPYLLLAYAERPLTIVKRYDRQQGLLGFIIEQARVAAAKSTGAIIVDRTSPQRKEQPKKWYENAGSQPPTLQLSVQGIENSLNNNESLCIFPQGERRPRSQIGALAVGTAYFALKHQVPIVPVDIQYYEREHCAIRYGSPVHPTDFGANTLAHRRELTEVLRQQLEYFTVNSIEV